MGNRVPMHRDRRPTQRDVAQRAGVSTATVSYILSGRRDRATPVTPETRARVLAAVEELGYQLNHVARSLRRQRTELICLVYRMPDNPWVERLTEQLQAAAEDRRYSVIVLPIRSQVPNAAALRVLRERYVDGAIVAPGARIEAGELRRLADAGLSLVVFDDTLTPAGYDVVDQSQEAACRALVRHLLDRGHRRIGFLAHAGDVGDTAGDTGNHADDSLALKYRSVAAAFADAGVPLDPELVVVGADSRARAYTETQRLLRRRTPPTALVSASDRGAIDAIWAARDLGRSVPGDLAVAGIGNTDEGEAITPALTTVGVPELDFTLIINRLFDRIDAGGSGDGRLALPWQLIVRDST